MANQRTKPLFILALLALGVALWLLWPSGATKATENGSDSESHPTQRPILNENGVPETPWFRSESGGRAPSPVGVLQLEGQVIDDSEGPVPDALVYLDSVPPRMARTTEDGAFLFDKLVPGRYRVTARAGDLFGGPVERVLTETSEPVVVRMVEGGRLSVLVVDSRSKKPVKGAEVMTDFEHKQLTDEKGLALVKGVTGTVRLWVRAERFASMSTLVTVPKGAGAEERIRVEMIPGSTLEGRVVDASDKPIAGARVLTVNPLELFDQSHSSDVVSTDKNGVFRFEVVPAGTYQFVAEHPMFASASSEVIESDGETPITVRLVMEAGGRLTGRVVNAEGQGVAGARVLVEAEQMSGKPTAGDAKQTLSGDNGSFELVGLSPRAMLVSAQSEGAASEAVRVDFSQQPERALELQLSVKKAIAGRVVDSAGEPVSDVKVVAYAANAASAQAFLPGGGDAMTDGGGAFSIRPLGAGEYRVGVERAPGDLRSAVVVASGTQDLELVLEADGALEGRVRYENGDVPESFSVALNLPPGKAFGGAEGAFSFRNVAPGEYDVTVAGPGVPEKIVRGVRVSGGQITDIGDIELSQGRTVTGRVTDASGSPAAGARVTLGRELFGDGGSLAARAMGNAAAQRYGMRGTNADDEGRFEFRGIGAGPFVVAAEHEFGRSQAVDLAAGNGPQSVELVLEPLASLRGRVVNAVGHPLVGVRVMATHETTHRQHASVVSDADGQFLFERLVPGPTTVTAMGGSGSSSLVVNKLVQLAPGESPPVELVVEAGAVSVEINVRGSGANVGFAEVFLFEGDVTASRRGELNRAMLSAPGAKQVATASHGRPARISGVRPGAATTCVAAIAGNPDDGLTARRLEQEEEALPVRCQRIDVTDAPQQSFQVTVPVTRL